MEVALPEYVWILVVRMLGVSTLHCHVSWQLRPLASVVEACARGFNRQALSARSFSALAQAQTTSVRGRAPIFPFLCGSPQRGGAEDASRVVAAATGNAFGTSVGSRTLSMKQAVVIAIIFEFTGALVLGRVITETIAGNIADPAVFQREPEIFAYGMMVALFIGGVWQILASYFEMNVSATHSIIGAIIGFAVVYGGGDAVVWSQKVPNVPGERRPFPPVKGVVPIVLSWFISPVLTGLSSAFIFNMCRFLVLRRRNAFRCSFVLMPCLVMLTVWINLYFVFTKGAAKTLKKTGGWTDRKAGWVSAVAAGGCTLISAVVVVPLVWKRILVLEAASNKSRELELQAPEQRSADASVALSEDPCALPKQSCLGRALLRVFKLGGQSMHTIREAALHGVEVDIHDCVQDDPIVAEIHANAEVFDPRAEAVFSYLQVFSAICVIFAHGAAEVGYMTGPLGAIWQVINTGMLRKKVQSPTWVVVISASGLVVGLSTYGYNITRAMGTRMAKLTPSRGFAAELSTSLVILVASQYGLPTSSSQCITGGIIGVALCEGRAGLNWRFFARTFASWVSTLVLVALITAAVFAQAIYAPSIVTGGTVMRYEDGVTAAAGSLLTGYTAMLRGSGYNTDNMADPFARSLNYTRIKVAGVRAGTPQTVEPEQVLGWLDTSLALYQTALTLDLAGQHVCPAAATQMLGYDPCTLPPTGDGSVQLTPLIYNVSAPPLDTKKQGNAVCTQLPCNQN